MDGVRVKWARGSREGWKQGAGCLSGDCSGPRKEQEHWRLSHMAETNHATYYSFYISPTRTKKEYRRISPIMRKQTV